MSILFTFAGLLPGRLSDSIFIFFYVIANQNIIMKCVPWAPMQHALFTGAICKKS